MHAVNVVRTTNCSSEARLGKKEIAGLLEFRQRINENRGVKGKELDKVLRKKYKLRIPKRSIYNARELIWHKRTTFGPLQAKIPSFPVPLGSRSSLHECVPAEPDFAIVRRSGKPFACRN